MSRMGRTAQKRRNARRKREALEARRTERALEAAMGVAPRPVATAVGGPVPIVYGRMRK